MANYIKSSRKEYICSCCKSKIYKGDSYYRNGDKIYCISCGPTGVKKQINNSNKKAIKQNKPVQEIDFSKPVYLICGWIGIIVGGFFTLLGLISFIVGGWLFLIMSIPLLLMGLKWKKSYKEARKALLKPTTVSNTNQEIVDPSKIIVFDVETTGLDYIDDEILQLSIIDGNYNVLFNEYFKPVLHEEWTNSEKVHGISPTMVLDKKPLSDFSNEIKKIFDNAEHLIGYNLEFDLDFITNSVIGIGYCDIDDKKQTDVMIDFAEVYGEYNPKYGDYKWQKLITCANYYGYEAEGNFHDSLEDVKATLYCYYKMNNI